MASGNSDLTLPEAVAQIRADLQQAQAAAGPGSRFSVEEVRLTLEVEAERTTEVQGGVRWYVVTAGARRQAKGRRSHQVELLLKPVGRLEVADDLDQRPDGTVTEQR
jgi:hypothetical protein